MTAGIYIFYSERIEQGQKQQMEYRTWNDREKKKTIFIPSSSRQTQNNFSPLLGLQHRLVWVVATAARQLPVQLKINGGNLLLIFLSIEIHPNLVILPFPA